MDPVTISLIAAGLAAGSGGLAAFLLRRRTAAERVAMRIAVTTTIPCRRDAPVCLLDVLWDLGSSDFALEMMAHRGLLLDHSRDLESLVRELPDRVAESGGYQAFIDELLDSIQEYYRDHRSAGDRRAIPALAAPVTKALPAQGQTGVGRLAVAHDSAQARDWEAWRRGEVAGQLQSESSSGLDLDRALQAGVGSMLSGLFDGKLGHEFKRWTAQREAKKARDALDHKLEELHQLYVSTTRSNPQSLAHLYDAGERWTAEGNRIALLREGEPYRDRSWSVCADVLLEESGVLAARLAAAARANVQATLARIDEYAAGDRAAMAGYLVYVNRYALFVGRLELCDALVRDVESASTRLRTELLALERQGLS